MTISKKILMLAGENDALPGGKVGGIGDVIRDLPRALANNKVQLDIAIPSYGFLHKTAGMQRIAEVNTPFGYSHQQVEIFAAIDDINPHVQHLVFHSPAFAPQGATIYCDDSADQPFATDATKYALFNSAVAQAIVDGTVATPNHLHCHDWHTAFILILREHLPQFHTLKSIPTLFSIHNIALQGIRPLINNDSSLAAWFPGVPINDQRLIDPRYQDCINPLKAALELADTLHTVSPAYAQELLRPSQYQQGVYGGDGLEETLKQRDAEGQLIGILNGIEYPKNAKYSKPSRKQISDSILQNLVTWASQTAELKSTHWVAKQRLQQWLKRKTIGFTVTSIGRLTEQKARLLVEDLEGKKVIDHVLNRLGKHGTFIMQGSGDPAIEIEMLKASGRHDNFIFLNGYSSSLADLIYRFGDLFLMPSSFEPCGISQMLAMRAGQPCLVNAVGGLNDTIEHQVTGLKFSGATINEQASDMLHQFNAAMQMFDADKPKWQRMNKAASKVSFTWQTAAENYMEQLYS